MTEQASSVRRTSPWGLLVALGGVLAVVGAFLPWAEGARGSITEQGGTFTLNLGLTDRVSSSGISHWTGIAALVGGAVALGAAVWLLVRRPEGRAAAVAASIGGVVVLAFAVVGFFQSAAIAGGGSGPNDLILFGETSFGVYVTGAGGLLATLAGVLEYARPRATAAETPAP